MAKIYKLSIGDKMNMTAFSFDFVWVYWPMPYLLRHMCGDFNSLLVELPY